MPDTFSHESPLSLLRNNAAGSMPHRKSEPLPPALATTPLANLRPSSAAKAGADLVGLNFFPRSLLTWIVVPNHGELGEATIRGVFRRRSISTAFTPQPAKKGPRSSSLPCFLPGRTGLFSCRRRPPLDRHTFSLQNSGKDRDQVAGRERGIQPSPRSNMVVVDKDIDVRTRLTALIANANVHLRMLPPQLGEQLAEMRGNAKLRAPGCTSPLHNGRSECQKIMTRTSGRAASIDNSLALSLFGSYLRPRTYLQTWDQVNTKRPQNARPNRAGEGRMDCRLAFNHLSVAVDFGQPGRRHGKLLAQIEDLAANAHVQPRVVGRFKRSSIQPPIRRISLGPMPRVVRAGVPMRMPEGSIGLRSSKGIMFLLTVMPQRSERRLRPACRPGPAWSRRPASGGCRCRR